VPDAPPSPPAPPRQARGAAALAAAALAALIASTVPAAPQADPQIATETAPAEAPAGDPAAEALADPQAAPVDGPLARPPAPAADPAAEAALFAMPRIAEATRIALARLQAGDLAGAAETLDALVERFPQVGLLHAQRAALAMLEGDPEAALAGLEAAAERAVPEFADLIADPVFAPLRTDPAAAARLEALAAAAPAGPPAPEPAPIRNGVAEVTAANTAWSRDTERLEPRFALPEEPLSDAVMPPLPRTGAADLLREHWRRGRAAGNHGDLYDNRDRGHSALDLAAFPQVTRTAYAAAAREVDLDYGLNDQILFDRITFGNSSTALTAGPHWRSLPRHALTRPDGTGPMRLWQNWAANHLYVHPAHRDYGTERGDLFPANTPYLIVSRGSSGSDRPFLEAVAMILASFKPETKARLAEERLVVPTVQFVFRRSLQNVRSRAAYFSGAAHPAAFEARHVTLGRMVSLAQSIEPGAIPAEARIAVIEEETGTEGVDHFGQGLGEALFDTPSAVARIWRSKAGRRSHGGLGRGEPRRQRPAARLRMAPAPGRPGQGDDRAARRRRARPHHPRLARPVPDLRGERPAERTGRHRPLRQQRRARQRPGDPELVLPAERDQDLRARPRRRAAPRFDRLRRPGQGRGLRRPAAGAAGRLARRAGLRRRGPAGRLDPASRRRAAGRLHRRRRQGADHRRRRAGPTAPRRSPTASLPAPTAPSRSRRSPPTRPRLECSAARNTAPGPVFRTRNTAAPRGPVWQACGDPLWLTGEDRQRGNGAA
jgi:hypothetical protein